MGYGLSPVMILHQLSLPNKFYALRKKITLHIVRQKYSSKINFVAGMILILAYLYQWLLYYKKYDKKLLKARQRIIYLSVFSLLSNPIFPIFTLITSQPLLFAIQSLICWVFTILHFSSSSCCFYKCFNILSVKSKR